MSSGAIAVMIPSPAGDTQKGDVDARRLRRLARRAGARGRLRRLADSYGETPLEPRWSGDRIRDEYELGLLARLRRARQAGARHLPRPAADERRFRRHAAARTSTRSVRAALRHRDAEVYDRNLHARRVRRRARGWPRSSRARARPTVNSVHHQGDQGPRAGLRRRGALPDRRHDRGDPPARHGSYMAAVQWHPEFHRARRRHARRPAAARRLPRRGPRRPHRMTTLKITNPADGSLIAEVPPTTPRASPRRPSARARRSRRGRRRRSPSGRSRSRAFALAVVDRARDAGRDADPGGRQAARAVAQRAERLARPDRLLPRRGRGGDERRDRVQRRRHDASGSATTRSASSPTSRPGTTRTSSAATSSCRRC